MNDKSKTCFVISPIGSAGSDIRRRSDCCLQYIIKPAFESLGFTKVERIDETDEAGQITPNIINKIHQADWCVADLSGHNANVFYEIGIRHAFQKPIIHMSSAIGEIPFDNSHQNTIEYIHDDPSSHVACIERIKNQVSKANENPEHFSTPVSLALGKIALDSTGDSRDEIISQLVGRISLLEMKQISAEKTLRNQKHTDATYRTHLRELSDWTARGGRSASSILAEAMASEENNGPDR
ncbi:hypothetical protein [Yoonia maritima]|uniref:hypothetical protein n=1 Tax=Yoonia maritima TaxID=1435347 RepID=UPI0037368875